MANDVLIVNTTSELSALPEKVEKLSGVVIPRAKMTDLTFRTLTNNISLGRIPVISERLNKYLKEMKDAIMVAATEEAEANIRSSVIEGSSSEEEKAKVALEKSKSLEELKLEQELAVASNPAVIHAKFEDCSVELIDENDTFYNGQKLVGTYLPNSTPKALMTPIFLRRLCGEIGKKIALYKHSGSIDLGKQSSVLPVASWRTLFEDESAYTNNDDNVTFIDNGEEIQFNDDIIDIESLAQRGLTEQELKDRRLKAEVGENIERINSLLVGAGSSMPFRKMLLDQKKKLLEILSESTGIDTIRVKDNGLLNSGATEFQALIDEQNGYKAPISEEEHAKRERELQEYYSDPKVQETIDSLMLKNILFDLNNPEFARSIDAAERKHNEELARDSISIETLDTAETMKPEYKVEGQIQAMELIKAAKRDELREAGLEQAIILHNLSLREAGLEQARILNATLVQSGLKAGAEEQAKMIYDAAVQENLKVAAMDQARMLNASLIQASFKADAEEQAKMIYDAAVHESLKAAAMDQARMLNAALVQLGLKTDAEEQAKMIYDAAVQENLRLASMEQAQMIYDDGVRNTLKEAALEQAQMLLSQLPTSTKKYETSGDIISRYAIYDSPSKPIRVNETQLSSLRSANADVKSEEQSYSKSMLVSLKKQLDELNLGDDNESELSDEVGIPFAKSI